MEEFKRLLGIDTMDLIEFIFIPSFIVFFLIVGGLIYKSSKKKDNTNPIEVIESENPTKPKRFKVQWEDGMKIITDTETGQQYLREQHGYGATIIRIK